MYAPRACEARRDVNQLCTPRKRAMGDGKWKMGAPTHPASTRCARAGMAVGGDSSCAVRAEDEPSNAKCVSQRAKTRHEGRSARERGEGRVGGWLATSHAHEAQLQVAAVVRDAVTRKNMGDPSRAHMCALDEVPAPPRPQTASEGYVGAIARERGGYCPAPRPSRVAIREDLARSVIRMIQGVYTHLRSPSAHAPVARVIWRILSLHATILLWHAARAAFRGKREEREGGRGGWWLRGRRRVREGGGRRGEDAQWDTADDRAGVSVRSPNVVVVALYGLGRRPRDE